MVSDHHSPVFTEGQMIVQNVFRTVSAEVTSLQDFLEVVRTTGLQDMQALFCGTHCKTWRHRSVVCKIRGLTLWFARHAGIALWFARHTGIVCRTDLEQLKMERVR